VKILYFTLYTRSLHKYLEKNESFKIIQPLYVIGDMTSEASAITQILPNAIILRAKENDTKEKAFLFFEKIAQQDFDFVVKIDLDAILFDQKKLELILQSFDSNKPMIIGNEKRGKRRSYIRGGCQAISRAFVVDLLAIDSSISSAPPSQEIDAWLAVYASIFQEKCKESILKNIPLFEYSNKLWRGSCPAWHPKKNSSVSKMDQIQTQLKLWNFINIEESLPVWEKLINLFPRCDFPVGKKKRNYQKVPAPYDWMTLSGRDVASRLVPVFEKINLREKVVADLGCNLGAASILALQKSAKVVYSYDSTSACIEVLKLLGRLNKVEDRLHAECRLIDEQCFNELFEKKIEVLFALAIIKHLGKEGQEQFWHLCLTVKNHIIFEGHAKRSLDYYLSKAPSEFLNQFSCIYQTITKDKGQRAFAVFERKK
jgi:hypothetical protein